MHAQIYIYIYIEREREREKEGGGSHPQETVSFYHNSSESLDTRDASN